MELHILTRRHGFLKLACGLVWSENVMKVRQLICVHKYDTIKDKYVGRRAQNFEENPGEKETCVEKWMKVTSKLD